MQVSADLEIEARSILAVHPAACKFANSEGDYTLAGFY